MARELLDTSVKGADDVAEITSAPVLGNIFQDNDAKRCPTRCSSTATPWAEAFRVLRTNMQYVDIDNEQKVFVLTSALPGEGKSTTAVNLAVTLTQAGQRSRSSSATSAARSSPTGSSSTARSAPPAC